MRMLIQTPSEGTGCPLPRVAEPFAMGCAFRAGPGELAYYTRGEVPAFAIEDLDLASVMRLPTERENSVRGTVTGPVP